MRSLKGAVELKIGAKKAWEMYRDDNIMSNINPDMLAVSKYIQGDGNPGSLRHFKLGPAVECYVRESTEKIEKVEIGKSVTYSVVGGELANMYRPYVVTFTFLPVNVAEKEKEDEDTLCCVAEWKAEFEPVSSATPPPERARDIALGFLKYFDKFKLPQY